MYDGEKHRHYDGVWRGSAEGDESRDPRRVGFYGIWYDGDISGGQIMNNTITDVTAGLLRALWFRMVQKSPLKRMRFLYTYGVT